jgi:hypothetical protein
VTRRTARPRAPRRAVAVAGAALLPLLLVGCGVTDDAGDPGAAPEQPGDDPPRPMRVSTPAPVEVPPRDVPGLPGPTTQPEAPGEPEGAEQSNGEG